MERGIYMNLMEDTFAKHFAHWKIVPPEENIKNRQGGYIQHEAGLSNTVLERTKLI